MSKVIVVQRGNRHRYAIARCFERKSMLCRINTTSSASSFLGKLAGILAQFIKLPVLLRLTARRIDGIPENKILSTDVDLISPDLTSLVYRLHGTAHASCIYAMIGEKVLFLRYAKKKGLKIIIDMYIAPTTYSDVNEAYQNLYKLAPPYPENFVKLKNTEWRQRVELADIVLCPSEYVADSTRRMFPFAVSKIKICSYGSSIDFSSLMSNPICGKIFWAGNEPLRKGLPILGEALTLLSSSNLKVECYAAGKFDFTSLVFNGKSMIVHLDHLSKDDMLKMYASADVFVMPSISEGQVGVVIEALSAGCPVVVTKESGVDIEDGVQGYIVDIGDYQDLANKIYKIISNRELRGEMSVAAKKFAKQYSISSWADRLERIVQDLK